MTKNFFGKISAAGAMMLLASGAFAQSVFVEQFPYTVGGLVANSGGNWTNSSGTAGTFVTINDPLSLSGLATSAGVAAKVDAVLAGGEDVGRNFTAITGDNQVIYASFLVKPTTDPTSTAGTYVAHFFEGNSGTNFRGRLFLSATAGGTRVGGAISGAAGAYNATPTVIANGATALVVMRYTVGTAATAGDDTFVGYVQTTPTATEPGSPEFTAVAGTDVANATGVARFALRQGSVANSGAYTIDEVRVGRTWADVVPLAVTGPEITVTDVTGSTALTSGDTVNFGSTTTGNSLTRNFSVGNTGPGALAITSTNFTGGYGFNGDTIGATIAPAGSDTFNVTVTSGSPGPVNGTLVIGNDDSNENPFTINFNSTFTAAPLPDIALSDAGGAVADGGSIAFGSVAGNSAGSPATHQVTITNAGTATLNLTSVVASGDFSTANFSSAVPGTLAASASLTFDLTVPVTSAGAKAGTLTVVSDSPAPENSYDVTIGGTVTAGAAPTLAATVPQTDATKLLLRFNKNIQTGGTYTVNPGAIVPTSAVVSGSEVTLTLPSALPGYPNIFSANYTVAATDLGSASATSANFVNGVTSRTALRADVASDGTHPLDSTTAGAGTRIVVQGTIIEDSIDNATAASQNATLAGSPGIVLRSFSGVRIETLVNPGDVVTAVGEVETFRGLLEILQQASTAPFITVNSTGASLPSPTLITSSDAADFANLEEFESTLVRLDNVKFVSGPGANFASDALDHNYTITNAAGAGVTPTITLRIDKDIAALPGVDGFVGKTAPTDRFDVIGILQQFDAAASPWNAGYQIIPLSYDAGILLPPAAVSEWTILD